MPRAIVPNNSPIVDPNRYGKRVDNHPGGGDVMTKQAMRDDTDINLIVAKYRANGALPLPTAKVPQFGDFTMATDLHQAMIAVDAARAEFMTYPAELRELAGNNPVTFLEMLADEGAHAALVAAGLEIERPPVPPDPGTPTGEPA